jgi:hypothetical protein
MARRTQHALQRQLKCERAHLQWLEQHLPQSAQLSLSKGLIAALALQCVTLSAAKQKKALHQQRSSTMHPCAYRC